MIKYNDDNKITLATFEVMPSTPAQENAVKFFAGLTPQQRAELIELGRKYLNRFYQQEADRVAGV